MIGAFKKWASGAVLLALILSVSGDSRAGGTSFTPISFAPGTTIRSADMNTNFQGVATALGATQTALTAQCGTGYALQDLTQSGTPKCVATGATYGQTLSGSSSPNTAGFTVTNGGPGFGVEGATVYDAGLTFGVLGDCTSSPNGAGVMGQSEGGGIGVWGTTIGGTASAYGVYGAVTAGAGIGVYGSTDKGTGVAGETNSASNSAGVSASNNASATGVALDIVQGYLQVAGAGANTNTTAFVWTASHASLSGAYTTIDNPMTNGNGNLILMVTQSCSAQTCNLDAHPTWIFYNGMKWEIGNTDNADMTENATFNILVISP